MLELSPARKNKVHLSDYNYEQDIQNRLLLADASAFDLKVLGEILYSPLKISIKKLARNLDYSEEKLLPILKKFSRTALLTIQDDTIAVDKDQRKHFEFQIARFDSDFKPDMEYIQGILRKVPIHILPTWYAIPRTSNNIFSSIVEKYLLSPQIFQRYLAELNFGDPIMNGMLDDLFSTPDFKITSSDLIAKYNLSRHNFEEILLFLEFNFICCLVYEKEEDHWLEYVTPFHEWREYLLFLKKTEAPSISQPVVRKRNSDFAFIEDLTDLLLAAKKKPLSLRSNISQLAEKLCLVQLAEKRDQRLHPLEAADEWLEMTLENRALHLYRHPMNRILSLPEGVANERNIREAEKSIRRASHGKWLFFDDFLQGVIVPLSEESVISLRRTGKQWKYTLPVYSEEEKMLLKATLFEWLFETGMVAIGTCQEKDCFAVTPFGRFFFEE